MVIIDGNNLSIKAAIAVIRGKEQVGLAPKARERVKANRLYLEKKIDGGEKIYGINTGFGHLSNISVSSDQIRDLQRNLILSHAAGYGPDFDEEIVRGIMLLRANALAKGYSGVRSRIIDNLLAFLNLGIHPRIPAQGSVGASGDLVPLAHMTLPLIGEGEVYRRGKLYAAKEALAAEGIEPLVLEAKEGLALVNGTQVMAALGLLAVYDGGLLIQQADAIAALSLEALQGLTVPFSSLIHGVRPHPGQKKVAENILKLIGPRDEKRLQKEKVQDAYSLRCIPQVHGASREALGYVRGVLEREINSATDNPLIFHEEDRVLSGGNFHGQPLALALDFLCMALAELGNISERRLERLVNPYLSGLPPFLVDNSGLNSGYMVMQYTAASLVSENKVLANPACTDSIPTSANQEDHVSMGTIAARKLRKIITNTRGVMAGEAICACQGIDLQKHITLGEGTKLLHSYLRRRIPQLKSDRILYKELNYVSDLIKEGEFLQIILDAGINLD